MTDAVSERRSTRRRPGALASVVLTLLILTFGFAIFGFTPAIIVTLYAGMVASWVALPYTVVAIVARESRARRSRIRLDADAVPHPEAVRFGLFRQRASLVNAIAMLTVLLVAVILNLVAGVGLIDAGSLAAGSLTALGAFALVGGVFAIVVNAPFIYSREIVASERAAMRSHTGAWRLIRATTILTTASWVAYSGFALLFITSMWS